MMVSQHPGDVATVKHLKDIVSEYSVEKGQNNNRERENNNEKKTSPGSVR